IWSASRSASKKGTLGGLQLVRGDHAVAQRHDAGSVSRNVVLVRDHDDRLAPVVQVAEHLHQLRAGGRVEVPGGLVGEQDRGLVHEGAGDRDALALAARQLVGPVVHSVAQPDAGERPGGVLAALAGGQPGVDQRQLHVGQRGVARTERLQGRHAVFFTILFAVSAACFAGRTRAPSFRSRIAWYGPATIVSSSFRPSSTSKYSSPAIPTLTGRNVAVPLFTTKTPSVSFFLRAVVVSTGRFSVDTGLFSRTVSAMIGIESACLRVSVTMRAVAERSGRTSPGGLVKVISTW